MSFVLDASITLAWCFQDEATPDTTALLERLSTEDAFVPALWTLEVGNILLGAERKGRISPANTKEFLNLLDALNIQIDHQMVTRGFNEILSLASFHNLTTYDAAYLELAMRLGIPLATKDLQLRQAANNVGVELY